METITVKDKQFRLSIHEADILQQVKRVAQEISRDMAGKDVVFVSVLNGAFMFTADLLKEIEMPCEVQFTRVASYEGTSTTGKVKELIGLNIDLRGRSVVIVEDIIDSGITMQHLIETMERAGVAELRVAALLVKHDNLQVPVQIDYECLSIPNDFIVGYGLDYDGFGRNLRNIYTVVD